MRVGESVWLARRKNAINESVAEYEKPIEIVTRYNYFTVMPASSDNKLKMIKSGENLYNSWVAVANARIFEGIIRAGDLMWLDGEKPITNIEEEYGNGSSATAEVKSAGENNFYMNITLERRQEQVVQ
jgi:hypothetical protein